MQKINSYVKILELKEYSVLQTQTDSYITLTKLLITLISINIILCLIKKPRAINYNQIKKYSKPVAIADILTTPKAGQLIGDDYFDNADLP